jgi:hypothetical protein
MFLPKNYQIFWLWVKITLFAFLLLSAVTVFLLVFLTILQVPSFVVGNDTVWLLRWQYQPDAKFAISFNPLSFFFISAVIGFLGVLMKQKKRKRL